MNLAPKFIIYLAVIALTYVQADDDNSGMSVKEIVDALKSFTDSCEPKPEEEHIKEVVKNIEDAQYLSKCFRHCLMQQFDFLEEGSAIMKKDTVIEMTGMMFSDRKDDIGEIVEECNNRNQAITEKCENAHAHGMCMFGLMKERGFDIPELKDE